MLKKILLCCLLSIASAHAIDDIKLNLVRLEMESGRGSLVASSFDVGTGSERISFDKAGEFYNGEIQAFPGKLLIKGENGFSISTEPVTSDSWRPLVLESGVLVCVKGGDCNAQFERMIFDGEKLEGIYFRCLKHSCLKNFDWKISRFNSDENSIFELKDLTNVFVVRRENGLTMNGKLEIPLIGKIDFEMRAGIVSFNEKAGEFIIQKVKIANLLSITDFTLFIAKKFFNGKSVSFNGDHLIVKF